MIDPSPRARALAAGALGLAGGAGFALQFGSGVKGAAWMPVVELVVAAVVAQVPSLGAQLLARGVWWAALVLGSLLCLVGSGNERSLGASLVAGAGLALVVADRRTLAAAAESAGFRPAAYAGTLQLLMVLALADAQTLGLFAVIEAGGTTLHRTSVAFGAASLAFLVGFVGLLRLALWGVVVTVSTAAALAGALATAAVRADRDLVAPLFAMLTLQVLAPVPMIVSMVTRRPLPAPSPRVRSVAATGVVVAVMAVSLGWWLLHRARPYRAW